MGQWGNGEKEGLFGGGEIGKIGGSLIYDAGVGDRGKGGSIRMLVSLGGGVTFLLRNPILYIGTVFLLLIQGGVLLIAEPFIQPLLDLGTLDILFTHPLNGIIVLLALLINASIAVFIVAWVAQRMHHPSSQGLIGKAVQGALVMGLAVGAWAFILLGLASGSLSDNSLISLVSLVAGIVWMALGIFAVVKWMFVFSFLGTGSSLKEALAQSWHYTQGRWITTLILGLVLVVIGALFGGITEILALAFENDILIQIAIAAGVQAIPTVYGAAVLAQAMRLYTWPAEKHFANHGKKG
ncbi:MAG: hypothetical protein Q8P05_03025 [Candidatus Diapherotrites archaeon]|nr:hypothetical protein [Candidatus Diapherotrites archaeon]